MTSIAAIPAFASLSGDAVAELARHTRPVRYRPGAVVRPADAAPEAVLLLLAGTIVAVYTGPTGGQVWPAHWDGPAIVDKPAALGGPAPSGALLATTRAAGLLLSHDLFLRLLDEHEPVRRHVLNKLAADTLALRERLADAATLPAVARVARWLLTAGAWHGSQEHLARELGLSRITVNRALGRLAQAAAVRLNAGGVRVTDPTRPGSPPTPTPGDRIASLKKQQGMDEVAFATALDNDSLACSVIQDPDQPRLQFSQLV